MNSTDPAMAQRETASGGDMTPSPVVTATSIGESRLAFSPDEAAELLGISRELVFDLLRTGQLKSVKAGRRRLISRANLDAFLAGEVA
jgi:excisionase family DNA binding protein